MTTQKAMVCGQRSTHAKQDGEPEQTIHSCLDYEIGEINKRQNSLEVFIIRLYVLCKTQYENTSLGTSESFLTDLTNRRPMKLPHIRHKKPT